MAQRPISEFFGKKLLYHFLPEFFPGQNYSYAGLKITADNIKKIKLPVFTEGYIAKPDELFGKRSKNRLIFMSKDAAEVKKWIQKKMAKPVTIFRNKSDKGISGNLRNFLVEPFISHATEYYLAIKSERNFNTIYFSLQGGVDIEENWNGVLEIKVPFQIDPQPLPAEQMKLISKTIAKSHLPEKNMQFMIPAFISALQQMFVYLDFTYLEINPFIFKNGQIILLDLVARLDDTALYAKQHLWEKAWNVNFPASFGSSQSAAENAVRALDERSGASLKFTVLNPNGAIWLLTSGGGGSVIFSDTVGDLGYSNDIANYGEYSGNPSTDETYAYTKIVLQEMLKSKTKNKKLFIVGGIANFTDIKKTFLGIVKALEEFAGPIKRQGIKIYVRRGGPNYKAGLEYMYNALNKLHIPVEVHGPEMYMTEIINSTLEK